MVEIFAVDLSRTMDPTPLEMLVDFLSMEKRKEVNRFIRFEDALRSATAEVLVKYLVMEKVGALNVVFDKTDFGKPFLRDWPDLHFNISHSGKWVVCAMDDTPIGIDIEQILPIDLSIAAAFFSDEEYHQILNRDGDERLFCFYDLWTLKESYLKAVGKGLFFPLNSFSIMLHGPEIKMKSSLGIQNKHFKQFNIDQEYKMSVCASNILFPRSVTSLSIDELCRSLRYKVECLSKFNIKESGRE